ncbi:MAG: hypothetical protein NVS4B3_28450 [Gemmatimonadaceae bacterium]
MWAAQALDYRLPLRGGSLVERARDATRTMVAPLESDGAYTYGFSRMAGAVAAGRFSPERLGGGNDTRS